MPLIYRPARAEDLATADALVAGVKHLTVRHGFGPMATASPPDFQLFSLSTLLRAGRAPPAGCGISSYVDAKRSQTT
jgi:hypothetical protein